MAAGTSLYQSLEVRESTDAVMQSYIAAASGVSGYTMNAAGTSLIFTRKYLPTWAIVVAILGALLFLIGLLALVVRTTETLTITLSATPSGGTKVSISGLATSEMASRISVVSNSLSLIG